MSPCLVIVDECRVIEKREIPSHVKRMRMRMRKGAKKGDQGVLMLRLQFVPCGQRTMPPGPDQE